MGAAKGAGRSRAEQAWSGLLWRHALLFSAGEDQMLLGDMFMPSATMLRAYTHSYYYTMPSLYYQHTAPPPIPLAHFLEYL